MTQAKSDKTPETPEAPEPLAVGELVELHDGCYALVVAVDPVSVVRLGHPQAYELPARKVG